MNKGAETRVFMEELEKRGLYNPRNPTGPLPTSQRPALNKILQKEGLDVSAVSLVFDGFTAGNDQGRELTADQVVEKIFQGRDHVDYYEFLRVIGTDAITWPN